MSRIAVLLPQVPFAEGGAEALVRGLVGALRATGCDAELVTLPFKWYPREELLKQPLLWRLLDLTESNGEKIDAVIATKFPSYCVAHPNKVVWLIHQFRQIYDLWGTPYSDFAPTPQDEAVRESLRDADRISLGEARSIFTIARTPAERLRKYCGLEGEVLYHPPPLEPLLRGPRTAPGSFVLSVGRLDDLKRVGLLLEAVARAPVIDVVVAGTGPAGDRLRALAQSLGLGHRVRFLGRVPDEALARLYRECRAVWFAPFDEDYGYVTLEAMLAGRPVITATDAGGVLEFVVDRENGLVAEPTPEAQAAALGRVASDMSLCQRLGDAGADRVRAITWDGAVAALLTAAGLR